MESFYKNIKTNNLKGIDFSIPLNAITVLRGVSGGGKSSLAVDTVFKISDDEMSQMRGEKECSSDYDIQSYSNIIPAVSLQQSNYNTNPFSTILTYFNLNLFFYELFSFVTKKSSATFNLSAKGTACKSCSGLGYVWKPDIAKIVDPFQPLSAKCFRPWIGQDLPVYSVLFKSFCETIGVKPSECKTFYSLSERKQHLLLTGTSDVKEKIVFKKNGRKRTRTAYYLGPLVELEDELKKDGVSERIKRFSSHCICPDCEGSRLAEDIADLVVFARTIRNIYTIDLRELCQWLHEVEKSERLTNNLGQKLQSVITFLEDVCAFNLGHLSLTRSIPSLSGGELQRLRLIKVCNSQFSNILYVLDEPTAGVHPSEWQFFLQIINRVKKSKNTLLLIEQNEVFDKCCEKLVYLGPSGGTHGGQIIDEMVAPPPLERTSFQASGFLELSNLNKNNLCVKRISVPLNTFVGICGVSGSGKTTFVREYLKNSLEKCEYLGQAPIRGNSCSTVSTILGLQSRLQEFFSSRTEKTKDYFSFTGAGKCPQCNGVGRCYLSEDRSVSYVCPCCNGSRYRVAVSETKIDGLSIVDYLNTDCIQLKDLLPASEVYIHRVLKSIVDCGLGYLRLSQATSTLSGGEAQRIKFIRTLHSTVFVKTFVFDEPFKGVDQTNVQKIISLFYELIKKGQSVFMIEHNPLALSFCSYLIEFGPGAGNEGGRIINTGPIQEFIKCKESTTAPFLRALIRQSPR